MHVTFAAIASAGRPRHRSHIEHRHRLGRAWAGAWLPARPEQHSDGSGRHL